MSCLFERFALRSPNQRMRPFNCSTREVDTACQSSLWSCSSSSLKSCLSNSIPSLLNPGMSTLACKLFSTPVVSNTGSSSRWQRSTSVAASKLFDRSFVGVKRGSTEFSRERQQRSSERPGLLRAASDARITLETNIEATEPNMFADIPAFSFLTSERMKVVVMLAFALALCNADRVVMSVSIVRLSSMFNWTTSFAGIVQSSFLWGYLLSPIIGGALVDRYGGKTLMAYGVGLWSLATFLTPWAANHSLVMLFAVRVLMGLAEGVAMPSMNNMVSRQAFHVK